jgi:outer membrane immunogenic protein
MKKIVISIAAIAAFTGSAIAADMAPRYAKAPPPAPVTVYNWTGCYVGGNVGGGWARTDQTRVSRLGVLFPADYGSSDNSQVIGGGQIGCDYQFAGNWVVGIQGMYDYARIGSSHALPAFPTFTSVNETKDVWTVTGRVGYLFVPQLLGYIKGGGAWTRQDNIVVQPSGALSETALGVNRSGWTVVAVSSGCSLRAGRLLPSTIIWTSAVETFSTSRPLPAVASWRDFPPKSSRLGWRYLPRRSA